MNQEQALNHLNNMTIAIQRYRSIVREQWVGMQVDGGAVFTDEFFAGAWPWVFGNKCPLESLAKVLDRKHVTGQEFYNFMYILEKFMPEIKATVMGYEMNFPMPEKKLIMELGK